MYKWFYICINRFTWMIFIYYRICYMKKPEVTRSIQFYQRNRKLPLPRWKQGNYPVIPMYDRGVVWIFCWYTCVIPLLWFLTLLNIGPVPFDVAQHNTCKTDHVFQMLYLVLGRSIPPVFSMEVLELSILSYYHSVADIIDMAAWLIVQIINVTW